ncbi:MAG: c-type cytochrome, partial [Acidobacteria bacterium]|nr:c-type cytochrome [Acidobacteriota bacterium]
MKATDVSMKRWIGLGLALSLAGLPARAGEADAGLAETGSLLVLHYGCGGCHDLPGSGLESEGKPGPDLRTIASKTDPGWALRWILAPRSVQPTTSMPHFFDPDDPQEARDVVAYLWASSEAEDFAEPPTGDAARGGHLFDTLGCQGCHLRDGAAQRSAFTEPYRLHGPNLAGLGSKVNAGWLFAWLKDPRTVSPKTSMPSLRLSEEEAADLTAYLMADRDPEPTLSQSVPEGDSEAGKEAIELYGCYGCHLIAGFEGAGSHAGELTSVEGFEGHGLLGLPDFALAPQEIEAIAAAVAAAADEDPILAKGRSLVAQRGCRGCHLVEGRGQALEAVIEDRGLLPPNLHGEGSKVQASWLEDYLRDPGEIRLRTWLSVRMPSFSLDEDELRTLLAYSSALEEKPFDERPAAPVPIRNVALGKETFELISCGRCHPTDADAAAASGLGAENLGPPLSLAYHRLRYGWIQAWLLDPQSWQPGTKMPTFFPESEPGVFQSPLEGATESPVFDPYRSRFLEVLKTEEELETFL